VERNDTWSMLHANFKAVASLLLGTDGDITYRWLSQTDERDEVGV